MEIAKDYELAALELQDMFIKEKGNHYGWSHEQFVDKVISQYPRRSFESFKQSFDKRYKGKERSKRIHLLDYANWVVDLERMYYEDSVDSMGPAGLDDKYTFEDFHESRRIFYTSSREQQKKLNGF